MNITKEQFWKAYNNHPPNWFIRTYWRFFSRDTVKVDSWVKKAFLFNVIILFCLGFFCTVFEAPKQAIGIPTLIYGILLSLVCFPGFIAFKMNQWRTNKIAKELGISREQYNTLVLLYYYELL